MQKRTLLLCIISDTPAFFKKIQIFGVALVGFGGTWTTIQGIPVGLITSLIAAGTAVAVAAIAQFTVKMDETNSPDPCSKPGDKPLPSETIQPSSN